MLTKQTAIYQTKHSAFHHGNLNIKDAWSMGLAPIRNVGISFYVGRGGLEDSRLRNPHLVTTTLSGWPLGSNKQTHITRT